MGQPDTVNKLPDHARLLNHKSDAVKKLLYYLIASSLWDKMPSNEIDTFNLFWNKM